MFKKWIIDWFLKDTLKGLLKGLNGNKTSLGLLGIIISGVVMVFPSLSGFAGGVVEVLPVIPDAPITAADISLAISSLLTSWGVVHKAWKYFKGQPQNPLKDAGLV